MPVKVTAINKRAQEVNDAELTAIEGLKRQLDAPRPLPAPLQHGLETGGKPRDHAQHIVLAGDRFGKRLLGPVAGGATLLG